MHVNRNLNQLSLAVKSVQIKREMTWNSSAKTSGKTSSRCCFCILGSDQFMSSSLSSSFHLLFPFLSRVQVKYRLDTSRFNLHFSEDGDSVGNRHTNMRLHTNQYPEERDVKAHMTSGITTFSKTLSVIPHRLIHTSVVGYICMLCWLRFAYLAVVQWLSRAAIHHDKQKCTYTETQNAPVYYLFALDIAISHWTVEEFSAFSWSSYELLSIPKIECGTLSKFLNAENHWSSYWTCQQHLERSFIFFFILFFSLWWSL